MIHSIRARLTLGYLGIIALLGVTSVAAVLVTRQVRTGYEHTVRVDDAVVAQIMLRVKLMDDEETGMRGYLLTGDPVFLQPYVRAQVALRRARLRSAALLMHEPQILPLNTTMSRRAKDWERWATMLLAQRPRQLRPEDFDARMLRGKALFDRYRVASDRVLRALDADRQERLVADSTFLDRTELILALIFPLTLVLVVGLAWWTTQSVIRPLARLRQSAKAFGRGDFTHPIAVERVTEAAGLALAMDRMRRELYSQRELTKIIGSTLQIDQVFDTFVALLGELVRFDRLSICLVDGDAMVAVFGAGIGTDVIPPGTRFSLARVGIARAYRTGEYIVQPDLTSVPSHALLDDERLARQVGVRSYAVIPLLTKGRIIGTLTLGSTEIGAYTQDTLHDKLGPVLSLAPLVAAAVDNARLYTSLDAANQELERMHAVEFAQARLDVLTGLGNRLRLREDLEALSKRAERHDQTYSVALCDVDRFKAYNDRYGHPAGDAILRTVAATLQSHVRQGDGVYRYGGEEFLLILPEQDLESAAAAAERLRQAVEQLALPHAARSPAGVVTISVGVAAVGLDDTQNIGQLLKEADAALYRAKRAGRNRVAVAGGESRVLRLVPDDEGRDMSASG